MEGGPGVDGVALAPSTFGLGVYVMPTKERAHIESFPLQSANGGRLKGALRGWIERACAELATYGEELRDLRVERELVRRAAAFFSKETM